MRRAILRQVVLREFLSHFVGRYADDSALAGIEILRKLEEFHSNGTFLERAGRTVNRVLDNVFKELPAPLAGAKGSAFVKSLEFPPDRLFLRVTKPAGFAFAHPLMAESYHT